MTDKLNHIENVITDTSVLSWMQFFASMHHVTIVVVYGAHVPNKQITYVTFFVSFCKCRCINLLSISNKCNPSCAKAWMVCETKIRMWRYTDRCNVLHLQFLFCVQCLHCSTAQTKWSCAHWRCCSRRAARAACSCVWWQSEGAPQVTWLTTSKLWEIPRLCSVWNHQVATLQMLYLTVQDCTSLSVEGWWDFG